jgi:TldD protein
VPNGSLRRRYPADLEEKEKAKMTQDSDSLTFEDHFGLSTELITRTLAAAIASGGDFSEIYLEYKLFTFIRMEEGIIKETAESVSRGAGIRVISGGRTGYAYTNRLDAADLKRGAMTAAAISRGSGGTSIRLQPSFPPHTYYPVRKNPHVEPLPSKISLVEKAHTSALEFDPCIRIVRTAYADQIQHITVANSEGLMRSEVRPLVKLTCMVIAENKTGRREAGYFGGGGRVGMEYFSQNLTPQEIGSTAAREAVHLLEAVTAPAGEMPVVLAPGHSGVLIHEAVGHLLEADFNRKKTSIFWDKMGRQVGSEQVNIYDDPTIPFFRGSYNMDDEGTLPRKTPLILQGKVSGLLQDRLSAGIMQAELTGHGRRQDYSCIPIPRMSNSYIDAGDHDPEEILKSVKRGFYAHLFQGGQVEDSGKFTFSVSSGFLIENGRLTAPVKQATLIGSNIDILNKITMVGSDLRFGLQTGTCGKEGQSAPVTDGCPTLKIDRMTVGGQQ